MPTLMSVCSLPHPETCEGRDLSDVALPNRDSPTVGAIYCEGNVCASPDAAPTSNSPFQRHWRAIVTDRYKLAVRAEFAHVENLFDLQEDPLELRNLVGKSEAKSVRAALLAELRDWASRSGDPYPKTPPSGWAQYSGAGNRLLSCRTRVCSPARPTHGFRASWRVESWISTPARSPRIFRRPATGQRRASTGRA